MNLVSTASLAMSGILIAVAIAVSAVNRLGLTAEVLWAAGRALAQLTLVGAALTLVIDGDTLWWSWCWVAAMVAMAGATVQRRSSDVPRLWLTAGLSFLCAGAVTLGVLFGFGIFEMTGRTVVPLAGMVVGNSMAATALVARRLLDDAAQRRDEIEARLALGRPAHDAARPLVRRAVRDALIPQIETTKTVGIVFLPGAMVGLILAGTDPADAVRVQVAVMYLILGSVATTTSLVGLGVSRQLFTSDQRVSDIVQPRAD